MVKVTRPLFGDSATGRIGNLGSFRQGRHGPEFITQARPTERQSPAQLRARDCFRRARAEWQAIPPTQVWRNGEKVWRIQPDWPTFWASWRAAHPECQP